MESEELAMRKDFDDWCLIVIEDPAKAQKASALVAAYWTAFQAGWAKRHEHDRIVLKVQDLEINRLTRIVTRAGKRIHLSLSEFKFLEILMLHAGKPVHKQTILSHAFELPIGDDVVTVYCRYLRVKVDCGFDRQLIQTIRGVGYQIG